MGTTLLTNPAVSIQVKCNLASGGAPAPATAAVALNPTIVLTPGTGVNQVFQCYGGNISVVSGTPLAINLNSGSVDPLGNAIAMTFLNGYALQNNGTSGQNLVVGSGTHPILSSDQRTVQPGMTDVFFTPTGFAVSGGSTDTLTITNTGSGTASAYLVLMGR